jgi:transmembrane sensor
MNNNLESLMRDVSRAVQGDARRRQLLPEIQTRLAALDEQSRQSQRAHGTWRLSLLGAAACAAGIAFFVMRPNPLSYAVDGAGTGRAGAIGERLVASASAPLSLRFSDGSQVTLPPHGQAHVDALDAQGATVALEEGTVDVAVVHRSHTRWSIRAGRYEIRVTGTKFSAGWDRRTDALTVTMREGSVEVTGPGLKAPARVVGGQRLRTNGAAADHAGAPSEVVVEDATTVAVPPPAQAETPAAEEIPAVADAPAEAVAERPTVAASRRNARDERRAPHARRAAPAAAQTRLALADAEWRGLEARGRMKEALAAALHEGDWTTSCRQLGADDLVKMGDIARVAGRPDLADVAYKTARQRFPSADRAIYGLGKLAFDQKKDYVAAGNAFETYVKRFQHGPLIHQAVGLWLESREKAGDNAGARDAAAAYLRLFPDGPKAIQARGIVSH